MAIFTLSLKEETLNKIIPHLIALATGSLLGGFFIHILPDLAEEKNFEILSYYILGGILFFYLVEKVLHWHHHHHDLKKVEQCDSCQKNKIKPVGYMILFSDGMHNFLDGVAVAGAFSVNFHLGIITTLLIIFHEIPKEIGSFGVLLNAGFSKWKAIWFNFLSGLTAIFGAILALIAISYLEGIQVYLTAIAGGSFIYIALVDLMPELHHKKHENKISLNIEFIFILLGIAFMIGVKIFENIFS